MISAVIWSAALFVTLYYTDRSLGKIEGNRGYIHAFLLWIFLLAFSSSFQMLGWAFGNPHDIEKHFFVPVGPILDWFNMSMWAALLVFGIIAIFLTFGMARRKESSRKIFVRLLPVFYVLHAYEFAKSLYLESAAGENSMFSLTVLGLLIAAIPFGAMYSFYSRQDIKKKIFTA